jgi:hypothetical protein
VPLGPANVGVRRMHTRRKEADDRECLGLNWAKRLALW